MLCKYLKLWLLITPLRMRKGWEGGGLGRGVGGGGGGGRVGNVSAGRQSVNCSVYDAAH